MGFGGYSYEAHEAMTKARSEAPRQEVFKQTQCHPLMDPHGIRLRESRDSEAHPNSIGVVFALDVTGSMGAIPDLLARKKLPSFMKGLNDFGVADPQVLFLAVGDATSDRAPLQVGQFEAAAKEIDQWLTWTFLEGGGGAFGTESYELAMYIAARHTDMDCFRKRGKRGYFFMTGDEHPYPYASRKQVTELLGTPLDRDVPIADVVGELQKTFEPFFLIPDLNRRRNCEAEWRKHLGDRVICMESPEDTVDVAAGLVGLCEGAIADLDDLAKRLRNNGLDQQRLGAVIRALTPFAATLGRAGSPLPVMVETGLPTGDGPSGHAR